ncbi:alpha/beta fold hydrolase [Pseudogemmobacter sonorensis]|uniref:alpha/beta fold hydrolase n=1 Tax=Pseudogemmobacter sonorensis TaxID=2989681 RepID=UPI0036C05E61
MTRFFTAFDGARLGYLDEGEGLPVLCLAGLTRNKADFDDALPTLKGCRVIRMDCRGRGESEYTGAPTYTLAQEMGDVLVLLDHLGLERVALLGTSRGGLIGLAMASMASDRLIGLCLNDVGPELDFRGLARIKTYVGRPPAARTLAEMARKLPAAHPGFEGVPEARWLAVAARLYRETERGLALRYDPALRESVLATFEAPPEPAWPMWQATGTLPVALIRGVNSDLLSAAVADRMQQIRPDLIRAEVPGRAHVPFLDEPEAVAALGQWLSACKEA